MMRIDNELSDQGIRKSIPRDAMKYCSGKAQCVTAIVAYNPYNRGKW
jgi:hypothetical protein